MSFLVADIITLIYGIIYFYYWKILYFQNWWKIFNFILLTSYFIEFYLLGIADHLHTGCAQKPERTHST
ncbi:protein of unknown function [Xenorhabdus doucetiae]|uniref:Uncharacterized protein n=1 Tax=Xenorhabdus doucetiae TaxID=351671 RepID=A0A068QSG7_9GAMM|nr:protein of unknown function [Xenorhabdus doucetiae]